jgi:hypothetical protein
MPNGDDTVRVQSPDGKVGTIPRSQLKRAVDKGYKLAGPKPQPSIGSSFSLSNLGSQAWQGAKEAAGGILNLGKTALDPRVPVIGSTHMQGGNVAIDPKSMLGAVTAGLPEEEAKARQLWSQPGVGPKVQAAGHELASYLPMIGPWAASLGEQAGKGDVGGALARGGAGALVGKKAIDIGGKVAETTGKYAAGLPEFIRSGQEGAATHAVGRLDGAMAYTKPKLDAAIKNVRGEVGAHAQAIVDADEMPGRAPGIPVSDIGKQLNQSGEELRAAAQAMPKLDKVIKQIDNIGINRDPVELQKLGKTVTKEQYAPFNTIKQLRTDIGSAMSDARDAGKYSEAKILGGMYKTLTEKMATRSKELGMSESFTKYNKLNETLRNMVDDGPLGDALRQDNGLKFFRKIREPGEQARLQDHLTGLSKYGLDVRDFRKTLADTKSSYDMAAGAYGSYMKYLGTKIGAGAAMSAAGVPHGFMFGMAAGLIGPKYAAALSELGTPMGKFGAPLEGLQAQRTVEGPTPVSQPTPPPPPPAAPPAPPPLQRSPIPPPSPQAVLESRVPLELRPRPGEDPMMNMLADLQKETSNPNGSHEKINKLTADLNKEFEQVRLKARVADAMQQYRAKVQAQIVKPPAPPETPKSAAKPSAPVKPSLTPKFDALPLEDRQWIMGWAKQIRKLPRLLQNAEMAELDKYGYKGEPIREKIATRHLAQQGQPSQTSPLVLGGSTGEAGRALMDRQQQRYVKRANRERPERDY